MLIIYNTALLSVIKKRNTMKLQFVTDSRSSSNDDDDDDNDA